MKYEVIFERCDRFFPQDHGKCFMIARGSMEPGQEGVPSGVNCGSFAVVGTASEGDIITGCAYQVEGRFKSDPRYGWQLKMKSFRRLRPHGRFAIISYIRRSPSFGPVRAEAAYRAYGNKALDMIRENPAQVADDLGMPLHQAQRASQWLGERIDEEDCYMELEQLFANHKGLHRGIIQQCIKKWGLSAAEEVRNNPWQLLEFGGVAFPTAYRVWCELGYDPGAIYAQARAIEYIVESGRESGSTYVTVSDAQCMLDETISAKTDLEAAIAEGIDRGFLHQHGQLITTQRRYLQESQLSRDIARVMSFESQWPDVSRIPGISEHQREQLQKATSLPMGCLEGSPGTGKTHTLARLCKTIADTKGAEKVCIVAFTNKAVARASEMIHEIGCNIAYATIHSMLEPLSGDTGGYDGSGWKFRRDRLNPLPFKYYILEEASMNDTELMSKFFDAVPPGACVLWVGDTNQLAPVSHGACFLNVIRVLEQLGGVGRLVEIIRNSGMTAQACADIRDHGIFKAAKPPGDVGHHNLVHFERSERAGQLTLKNMIKWIESRGDDPIKDMMVITSTNERGAVSRKKVNEMMQDLLNADGVPEPNPPESRKERPFRAGDRVVFRENEWFPIAGAGDSQLAGMKCRGAAVSSGRGLADGDTILICNGHIGWILEWIEEEDKTFALVDMGPVVIRADMTQGNWQMAYGITCHISQGSQFRYVAVCVGEDYGAQMVMSKEWFTTACSRAQLYTCTIGRWENIEKACSKSDLGVRHTRLTEMIEECLPSATLPSR